MMSKIYNEIDFYPGRNIEDCVNELLKYKEKGQLVFGSFNGYKLYSDTVTLDSAYKLITGRTKKEFDDEIRRQNDEYQRQKQEHINNIPKLTQYWMEKGREVLDSSKWKYWDSIVPVRLNDLYQGMELGQCLELVSLLKEDKFDEAKELINNQGHSGMSFSLVCSMVKEFSSKGEEFIDFIK